MRRAALLLAGAVVLAPASAHPQAQAPAPAPGPALEPTPAVVDAGRDLVILRDTLFFPEGLDVDPATGTLYLTSIRHRAVVAVARDGSWREVLVARGGAGAAFDAPARHAAADGTRYATPVGVAFDARRGVLWVATAALPTMHGHTTADSARAELLRMRLADGAIVQRWPLGDGRGVPGEIAVTAAGDVLVSDGIRGELHRLRPGADTLETLRDARLRSPQGIAVDARGAVAWVADWSRGIFRWDLATGALAPVAMPGDAPLQGIDGLRYHDGALVGVQNGARAPRVVRLTLARGGRAVTAVRTLDRPARYPGEPTVGAVRDGRFVFVASSGWPFWDDAGARRAGSGPLPPVTLREVPLPR